MGESQRVQIWTGYLQRPIAGNQKYGACMGENMWVEYSADIPNH